MSDMGYKILNARDSLNNWCEDEFEHGSRVKASKIKKVANKFHKKFLAECDRESWKTRIGL